MPNDIPLCNQIAEMIELVVDGTDPQVIEELMTIKFFAVHNYTGIEALLYFLYVRSMLMIQAGMSPWLIEQFFNAVLSNGVPTFERERIRAEEEKRQKIDEWKKLYE